MLIKLGFSFFKEKFHILAQNHNQTRKIKNNLFL
jgi:hypothetical protein